MQEFPPNSHKAKATGTPQEALKPVTSATKTGRRRGLGRQFKDTFFSGSPRDVTAYMIEEVVVPAVRDMFADALRGGIERLIYGDRATRLTRTTSPYASSSGHVPYNRMSGAPQHTPSTPMSISRRSRARHDFSDLVIPKRPEAEEVIDQMFEILSRYGYVTVAQLYELTGIRPEHTDMKWGWTELPGAKPLRLGDGRYVLNLPEPRELR